MILYFKKADASAQAGSISSPKYNYDGLEGEQRKLMELVGVMNN